jgi:hypothetical protein
VNALSVALVTVNPERENHTTGSENVERTVNDPLTVVMPSGIVLIVTDGGVISYSTENCVAALLSFHHISTPA